MHKRDYIDLNIDVSALNNFDDYLKLLKKLGRIEIKMVEKNEQCRHNLGDTFIFENPYIEPKDICSALLHVLNMYTWRVALGFPSLNEKDRRVYKLHCPDAKGTVWEMRKIED